MTPLWQALDLVDYQNAEWLKQWWYLQEYRCYTWNVIVDLIDDEGAN